MKIQDEVDAILNDVIIPATYINTNLPNAVDSGNEIMIRCNSYYAINPHVMHNMLISEAIKEILS